MPTEKQIEREKTNALQRVEKICVLREKLGIRTGIFMNLEKNRRETWFKPDKTPLSDYELRVPDSWAEHNIGGGFGNSYLMYWCRYSIPQEIRSRTMNDFDRDYHARKLNRDTFGKYLQIAVNNRKKEKTRLEKIESPDWLDKHHYDGDVKTSEFLETQLAEHLATPYSDQPFPPKIPYQAREITSEQLQQHLGEMEKRDPSLRYIRGQK
jgi:hypothetical protein